MAFILAAAGVFGVLCLLAAPADRERRLDLIETRARSIESFWQNDHSYISDAEGAMCYGNPLRQTRRLEKISKTLAQQNGVRSFNFVGKDAVQIESTNRILEIPMEFSGNGESKQIYNFVLALSNIKPRIFVDRTDIKSNAAYLSLKILGEIYCRR